MKMNKGKTVGYVRVSTEEQNPERQLNGLHVDKLFIEYASGSKMDRYQLNCMLDYIRDDDLVIVHSMDRLARNVRHLLQLVEQITAKRAKIQFLKENLIFSGDDSSTSKLLLTIMGAVAQFELALIKERQAEGIKAAKAKGKYKGRKTVLTPSKLEIIHEELKTRKPICMMADDVGISRETLYKYVRKLKEEDSPLVMYYKKNHFEPVTFN